MKLIHIFVYVYILLSYCDAWREWNYSSTAHTLLQHTNLILWREIWGDRDAAGKLTPQALSMNGPHSRRGHSLVVIGTYLVMFGGRDNNKLNQLHIPKTYNVEDINGTLEFTTYDEKPISPCLDPKGLYYSAAGIIYSILYNIIFI
jgi:hypothetical protein